MDISNWGASNNPKYCFEWSFIDDERLVLNLWYDNMEILGKSVSHNMNFRADALQNRINNPKKGWHRRGLKIDEHLQIAVTKNIPVRIILLEGDRRKTNDENEQASYVYYRHLDSQFWSISHYDFDSGECVIERGKYCDQFSQGITDYIRQKDEYLVNCYFRDRAKRQLVLERAKGRCEYCGTAGFLMENGAAYIETHHITPLSEFGADEVWNMIALCPTHHREAHYGLNRHERAHQFRAFIKSIRID
ncbi:HNH endonuclease signature motif containing protein [Asticcacaulis sp. ZE23SCel15]|uniref:HNH endonuclease n=1 Tax=Asticcacaulis sp. ZE23SCel15 TaxID=3059027 RepID=UPI00265D7FD8|nr:HNH endonuclease signature motif containing protein [Asticcacaulis sp. ZE23SCel15]WKL56446.1 HNH endonuclease signature motif containing protein [Asticcacaulis sp. ZE23SCel15]